MFKAKSNDAPEVHVWRRRNGAVPEFEEYFKYLSPNDAVLDLGCGEGNFLRVLKERGFRAKGVDLNISMASKLAREGLEVIQADAVDVLREMREPFNVVSMLDFAEHIPLDAFLWILREVAKVPGTKLFLQTPNLDSIMGIKFYFHLPSHITPLHPVFLKAILEQYQFENIAQWTDYGGLPWKGFRRWFARKVLNGILGPPLASMFEGGGNICLVARAIAPRSALQSDGENVSRQGK
jgi:2-polyprenyl-3-methyl-5-hydroxy-6-metoxy-1,4-benzoquinol methylase